jgi:hypothetical protein
MERENVIIVEPPEHRQEPQQSERVEQGAPSTPREQGFSGPLLGHETSEEMRSRWESIQARFIDDPTSVVKEADELVATAVKRLSETFAKERLNLERQWSEGNSASTEDLRLALRKYRAFFNRLLVV